MTHSNSTPLLKRYRRTMRVGMVISALVALIAIGEVSFVSLRYLVKGPMKWRAPAADHPALGWVLNIEQKTVQRQNRCGESVIDLPPPSAYLSKTPKFDHPTRVLFIGDSFTHGHEVSTGSRYYDHFEEIHKDSYSVYAAGVGGYGSLQEYLLLNQLYPELRPDVVAWQLHANDLINNVYEFEKGVLFNNRRPRPYLDLDRSEIYIADPAHWIFELESSRFVLERFLVVDHIFELGFFAFLHKRISPPDERLPILEQQGFETLSRVLDSAMEEHPETLFVGFNVVERYESEFRKIFIEAGAGYIADLAKKIASDPEPTNCQPLDEHWNHHGNAVAGRVLAEALSPQAIETMRGSAANSRIRPSTPSPK